MKASGPWLGGSGQGKYPGGGNIWLRLTGSWVRHVEASCVDVWRERPKKRQEKVQRL